MSALDPVPGLVWAFAAREGGCVEVPPEELESALGAELARPTGRWFWLHFDLGDRRALRSLRRLVAVAHERGVELPGAVIEDFSRLESTPALHYTRGVLHGALLDSVIDLDGGRRGEAALLKLAVCEGFALTGRRRHLRGVEALRLRARGGEIGRHPASVVEALVRSETSQREGSLEALTRTLDTIEDLVLGEAGPIDRSQVLRIRHGLVRQHRELAALARLFERVDQEIRQETGGQAGGAAEWTDFGPLQQHLDALVDTCLALLDRARLLQQEVSDQLTAQTNRQLYVLSILTAALVPPTIVVGVFGMNTGGLPLTATPYGFAIALGLCVLSSLAVLGVLAAAGLFALPRGIRWPRLRRRPEEVPALALDAPAEVPQVGGVWGAQVRKPDA